MLPHAVVLIHSQGNSVGPLREAIEHYMPQMVFLISNAGADKAMLALSASAVLSTASDRKPQY